MTRRRLAFLMAAVILLPVLAACGKKSALEPPSDAKQEYPRQYPTR